MNQDKEPIEYYSGIFEAYKESDNLEWDGFAEIMYGLGFEMDCLHSFAEYEKSSKLKCKTPSNERERKRKVLYQLEHADRQIVGNCLFSEWRYYTHWAYCYDKYDVDFIKRIIKILEDTYK